MHSCVFSVHSSIRPWSPSPQIYFLLGFSSDASIKLWEDDAADFRCRGGLRFMMVGRVKTPEFDLFRPRQSNGGFSILQFNGFYHINLLYNLHLFNDNIILIFVWWTNQIKVQLHGYWLPIARFKSNSSPNSKVKILSFFLLRVWALAWRWHGTGRALLAILGRFGHLWLGPAST